MKALVRSAGRIVGRGLAAGALVAVSTATATDRKVEGILDNSFLVEEAYNQEPGVVQHIFTAAYGWEAQPGPDRRAWELAFTQEWPCLSQRHQLSYSIPFGFVGAGGESDEGLGDILVNYRHQVYLDEAKLRAFAPRFSLMLPTGNAARGFGEGSLGYQLNLPFSTALNDEWFLHLNAGATFQPDAASAHDRDLWHFNLGVSLIYAATEDVHVLVEWIGEGNEGLAAGDRLRREFGSVLSPGLRKAFNFDGGAQVVVGVAAPVGLTGHAPDYGVFLYLSLEHGFGAKP